MYSKLKARRNARKDAKNNLPGRDDPNFAQFEQELMAMARYEARQVTAACGPKLEVLAGKHEPLSKDYERLSRDYDAHAATIGRSEPHVELTKGKYYILMTLFVLGEIPMNTLAFSVFGESQIFTWIMAVGVAVSIPWIAHAVGILLKRSAAEWWKTALGVGTLLAVVISGLAAIGYVRVQYLGDLNEAGAVGSFGSSTVIGLSFVGLNLVILVAATLCSYFAHDKDPKLQHLHHRTNQLDKALQAVHAKYKKILSKQEQEIHRIQQAAQEVIYFYRKINQRLRPDHEKPKSFEKEHKMGVEFEKEEERRLVDAGAIPLKAAASQSA